MIIIASMALCLGAQYAETGDMQDYDHETEDYKPELSQRVPGIFIIVILIIFSLVLYYVFLHIRFYKDIEEKQLMPSAAATRNVMLWLNTSAALFLVFVGFDIINLDLTYGWGHYIQTRIIPTAVVVLIWVFLFFITSISSTKSK
jgi:hypothetical protein